jgi:hypothetical protein
MKNRLVPPGWRGDIVKKGILAVAVAAAFVIAAPAAHADTFKYDFCPVDDSCPDDLTEGSLTFETLDATVDLNDYTLTVRFVGTLNNLFIDTIDFTAGLEFASLPSLTSAPTGTVLTDWMTNFDKVNASAGNNCDGEIANHLFACSKATIGNGPSVEGVNEWVFSVNFLGTDVLDEDSVVDLRALFVDGNGRKAGLMSPSVHTFDTTGPSDTTGTVPEPAMLSLFGAALALGAHRLRVRR